MSVALRAYCPYGHHQNQASPAFMLGFNGERYDPFTYGYALGQGYRNYSPALMRFQQPDDISPFGLGGLNAYAYCNGDPLNYRDDTGHARTVAQLKIFWERKSNRPDQLPSRHSASPPVRAKKLLNTKLTVPNKDAERVKRVGFINEPARTFTYPQEGDVNPAALHQEREALWSYIQKFENKIEKRQKELRYLLKPATLALARHLGIKDKLYLAEVQRLDTWVADAQFRLSGLYSTFSRIRL